MGIWNGALLAGITQLGHSTMLYFRKEISFAFRHCETSHAYKINQTKLKSNKYYFDTLKNWSFSISKDGSPLTCYNMYSQTVSQLVSGIPA